MAEKAVSELAVIARVKALLRCVSREWFILVYPNWTGYLFVPVCEEVLSKMFDERKAMCMADV